MNSYSYMLPSNQLIGYAVLFWVKHESNSFVLAKLSMWVMLCQYIFEYLLDIFKDVIYTDNFEEIPGLLETLQFHYLQLSNNSTNFQKV